MRVFILSILLLSSRLPGFTQLPTLTISEVVSLVKQNHPELIAARLRVNQQEQLLRGGTAIPKTDVSLLMGQYNSIQKQDNNFTISQTIPFPTAFITRQAYAKSSVKEALLQEKLSISQRILEAKLLITEILYLEARATLLAEQDSLLKHTSTLINYQYIAGDKSELAKLSAESQLQQIRNARFIADQDLQSYYIRLQLLCGIDYTFRLNEKLVELPDPILEMPTLDNNIERALSSTQWQLAIHARKLESSKALPDLHIGYFSQTLIGTQTINGQELYFSSNKRFQGMQVGLSIPLIFFNTNAQIKSFKTQEDIVKQQKALTDLNTSLEHERLVRSIQKDKSTIDYYNQYALPTAQKLKEQSAKAFNAGEIDLIDLSVHRQQELQVQESYLLSLLHYHQNIARLTHLTGQ